MSGPYNLHRIEYPGIYRRWESHDKVHLVQVLCLADRYGMIDSNISFTRSGYHSLGDWQSSSGAPVSILSPKLLT